MTPTPDALWQIRYPFEESIAQEHDFLRELRKGVFAAETIAKHIAVIRPLVERLDLTRQRAYAWARHQEAYAFGPEAFYQARLLTLLGDLQRAGQPLPSPDHVVCARQLISPAAFNGTPRIATIGNVSFVIFPAPAIGWLYTLFEQMMAVVEGRKLSGPLVELYLHYLVGARTFEAVVELSHRHELDYVIEEIVLEPDSPSIAEVDCSALTLALIDATEEFVLCHELAHQALGHAGESSMATIDIESAADRLALEMLSKLRGGRAERFAPLGIDNTTYAHLGFIGVRLWTGIRLIAEERVLLTVHGNPQCINRHRERLNALYAEKQRQIQAAELSSTLPISPIFRAAVAGYAQLVDALLEVPLQTDRVARIHQRATDHARRRRRS